MTSFRAAWDQNGVVLVIQIITTSFRAVWDQNGVVLDKSKTTPFWSQTALNDVVMNGVLN